MPTAVHREAARQRSRLRCLVLFFTALTSGARVSPKDTRTVRIMRGQFRWLAGSRLSRGACVSCNPHFTASRRINIFFRACIMHQVVGQQRKTHYFLLLRDGVYDNENSSCFLSRNNEALIGIYKKVGCLCGGLNFCGKKMRRFTFNGRKWFIHARAQVLYM